jgi:hypothetical protein
MELNIVLVIIVMLWFMFIMAIIALYFYKNGKKD